MMQSTLDDCIGCVTDSADTLQPLQQHWQNLKQQP